MIDNNDSFADYEDVMDLLWKVASKLTKCTDVSKLDKYEQMVATFNHSEIDAVANALDKILKSLD